jgi:uncharacterized protein involved in outer membrane biogenesis
MSETITAAPAPHKRRSWLKIATWAVGLVVLLMVVVYFVATSSAFFKGVILPKASAALNATITVSDASISPFSQVVLKDLRVQTTGPDPLVLAPEVRLRYSLMSILRGQIKVEEVTLASPTVTLVQNPDGTSNLDPILKAQAGKAPKAPEPAKPATPSKPLQVDLTKLALTDATVRQIKLYSGNRRDLTELAHMNVTLENLKNGQTAKLTMDANISVQNNPPAPGAAATLEAKVNGSFNFALTPDLKPGSIQGSSRLEVVRATGALAQAAAFAAQFDCEVTPTEIKQAALRVLKGSTRLAEFLVSGTLDLAKAEGHLTAKLINVDKNLLNLAGANAGIDFGTTTISSTNDLVLAKSGTAIALSGQFDLNQFQVTRTNQTTPSLDLRADYSLSVDTASSVATLKTFSLIGMQKGNNFLQGNLTSPMTVDWGKTGNAVGDSALNVAISHFDLADWKAFLGSVAPAGDVNMKFQLLSQQGGKQLTFDFTSDINQLTAGTGSNQISQLNISLRMRGKAASFNQFDIPEYNLQIARQDQPLAGVSGTVNLNQTNQTADIQLNAQLFLSRLAQALARPDLAVASGTVELKTHIIQKQAAQNISGGLTLSDLTGTIANSTFQHYGANADLDVAITPQQVQIRKIEGKLTEGQKEGGLFTLTGTYDLSNQVARISSKASNFNQNGLRPFLAGALGDKSLTSVAVNASADALYDPKGASSIKADLQITNLVVNDPKGQIPATPLETTAQLDIGMDKLVTEIRKCQLGLTPTARATNQLLLTGRIDMSRTNLIQGNLKLAADSIDLTRYYDIFGSQKKPATTTAPGAKPPPATTPVAAGPETEPEGKQLPVTNFTAEASIRRLYLHEVEVADFACSTRINGGRVTVDPFKLNLNGAPVSSTVDLDLGVRGYKYNLAFSSAPIPLAPLVNTFQPERKGLLSGTFTAQGNLKGEGTTGPSLQTNLSGAFNLSSTNLNLAIDKIPSDGLYTRLLKTVVNAIVLIPDLAKNPSSTLTSLLAPSAGGSSAGSDLGKSPINAIVARGQIGSGRVDLLQTMIESPAFRADATGTITLAAVLTNSPIQIPVAVSIDRAVAQRINLLPENTPTNATYVRLPDFLAMNGTVGEPKTEINKLALAGTAIQGLSGLGGRNSGLLQGIGSALTGTKSSGTNAPSTGTNPPSGKLGGLLQGLGGALGGSRSAPTNAPGTNQPPSGNLLNNLFGPKK